ncbi:MAG: response regulator [Candidatus Omnitrophica bacterium]|nr:response regulator [Candidatus Omnitrophota bacterium]
MDKKFKILLVDDESDFIEPIAFWLESKGYDVQMAVNGQQALQSIDEDIPDIVLLDINMPVMDGIETLRKIRAKHQTLPVIMITAAIEQISVLQDLNIAGFFPKSGSLTQLEQLLDPVLRLQAKMKPKP